MDVGVCPIRSPADGLLTLAGAKLVLPGLGDTDTLQRLETLIGKQWVEQVSQSEMRNGAFWGDWSWGTYRSETEEARIPAARIRQLPPGRGIAIIGQETGRVIRLCAPGEHPLGEWTT